MVAVEERGLNIKAMSPFNITVSIPLEDERLLKVIMKFENSNVKRSIVPENVEGPFIVILSSQ